MSKRQISTTSKRRIIHLASMLHSMSSKSKIEALKELSSYREQASFIAASVIPLLGDEDSETSTYAMHCLVEIGNKDRHVVTTLRSKLELTDRLIGCRIYWILERIES